MLKMSRLSPQVKALESKYGDDKQKYQLAVQQLYKEEGVSMGGGCLWSFIPLIILLPLYYIIREPITYMMHNPQSTSAAIVAFMQASGVNLGKNAYYAQLAAAGHIGEFMDDLKALAVTANANLQAMNFQFLGIDLSGIPSIKFWECEGWGEIGLFLIPVVSAGLQSCVHVDQPEDEQPGRHERRRRTGRRGCQDGQPDQHDHDAHDAADVLWIGFSMPAAISIYWIAQAVFGAVQDYFLTKHYRKVYEEEDAVRQELAAKRRAEEAEKERQRALRREQNPDGITDNVSKKKIRQQEKEAAEKAARDYEAKKNPVPESEVKKPLSGDPERPYCRGRAYDPSHYGRKRAAESDAEQTKE
ncbi:MAG: YidC/Oxa1 family membrane protein insertase [Oscillospiraceae bacterium]